MAKGNSNVSDTRALYRKYRSKSLDEVVGQPHITTMLSRALQQGKIGHAYLFTGPRGVGKTSVARILAHEINNVPYDETTQHPDIIEIDAASNRRIDDIRDLRDKVAIAPADAPYKVYIIDEVHMLTGESFNAFLKTLEEPPAHVVFILATTDAHKLPATITSRTQRFAFRAISEDVIAAHLRSIADKEKIEIDDDALTVVARHGDGSFRDSISLLDQLSSLADKESPINLSLIERVLGIAKRDQIDALISAYQTGDQHAIITTLDELERDGIVASVTTGQLIERARELLATTPQLQVLLTDLIDVISSPRPDIKLLTVLLSHTSTPPLKHSSARVSVSAELQPLAREATRTSPSERRVKQESVKKDAAPEKEVLRAKEAPSKKATASRSSPTTTDFDWNAFTAYFKQGQVALATILAKCAADHDDTTLTIYARTSFWKNKLDNAKYQQLLHDGLAALGMNDLSIEILPTVKPPKDSQAAAVAAIMGGGEEVEL